MYALTDDLTGPPVSTRKPMIYGWDLHVTNEILLCSIASKYVHCLILHFILIILLIILIHSMLEFGSCNGLEPNQLQTIT